jgi:hypothetical protein
MMDRMTIKTLRETVAARRPFRLFTADGRTIEVPHPEFVAMEPSERVLYVAREGEKLETLDLLLVVGIEETRPLPPGK